MFLAFNPYLLVGIGIILLLVAIFFISWFLNRKTPVPKGCENLRVGEEACGACHNTECDIKLKVDLKKVEEELKEEKNE